jgi:hypothetical protein
LRARSIKPGVCDNEILGTADPFYTLLFERLWMLADREGRLEDRPLRIKAKAFPYREGLDVEPMLRWLDEKGFIARYEVDGCRYIQVLAFWKHQSPHKNEQGSVIPPIPDGDGTTRVVPKHNQGSAKDALTPSSLTPDSGLLDSCVRGARAREIAESTEAFARLKAAYPPGTYRQSEWLTAERDIEHHVSTGHAWAELHEGVERYARQLQAMGKSGTQYVLSPSKFFARGPLPKFLEPYPLPAARAGPAQKPRRDAPTTAELEALEAARAGH